MARIFLSHSSVDNAQAIALRDWLVDEGWDDLFLDLDRDRGIAAGERWERALNEAAARCEAVLFLISRSWLNSRWCMNELNLARRLNKRIFGVLIEEGLGTGDLPRDVTSTWQLVNLSTGRDHKQFPVKMPFTGDEVYVTFSHEGLARLKAGLHRAGLHASFFNWPPETDPNRSPFRGLRPLEADDAGIFFGREAPIIKAIDLLRGLREGTPPRVLVILGASGAGKSSFLRAGLYPRLQRDESNFLPLPIIRPERAALTGESGLLKALAGSFEALQIRTTQADLRAAIPGGVTELKPLLQMLADKAASVPLDGQGKPKSPTLVLSIDQGEEMFRPEGQEEAQPFIRLLRDLVLSDAPSVIAIIAMRSDEYERLQESWDFEGIQKVPFDLGPMPRGSYAELINGPVRRLDGGPRALKVEPALVQEVLSDIEAGGAKDALPLLAFTMERLYDDFHISGELKLDHYERLGRVRGSIEAAIERAFRAADADPAIPKDRAARLAILRRGLIPWLAGIDLDTGAPRRRVARLSEIPAEARPLIDHLVDQRLLATDVAEDTREKTIEPAHESLLRQWGLLQGWLAEDAGLLGVMEGVKRASRDWAANGNSSAWHNHAGERLSTAQGLRGRPDLSSQLEPTDWAYLAACHEAEVAAARVKRRHQTLITTLVTGVIIGLVGWINQAFLKEQLNWWTVMRPYMVSSVQPHVLLLQAEKSLMPGQAFRECAKDCPEMIVIPAGSFTMGSPVTEPYRRLHEGPQQTITFTKPFAVAKYHVTFAEWDACVAVGGCREIPDEQGIGRGTNPVIGVTWKDAAQYAAWLSLMTGQPYRLLSEAEFEYAARAGSTTAYPWGNDIGKGNANCKDCGGEWNGRRISPVGSFAPNAFGLYDMHSNVRQWTEDCYQDSLEGVPLDGSARTLSNCTFRVHRGGSWFHSWIVARSAFRQRNSVSASFTDIGIRIGRTLSSGTGEKKAPSSESPSPLQPSVPLGPSAPAAAMRDALLSALTELLPKHKSPESPVQSYLASKSSRALAVHPPAHTWRSSGWDNFDVAEQRVLEACEVRYGAPCILIAVDDTVLDSTHWTRRSMPRVAYDGLFDPQQLPIVRGTRKLLPDVIGYPAAPKFKAAALHPWGRLFLLTGADSQRNAELQALAACNLDQTRNGRDGPCLLYAVDDQVVLPKRLTVPLTAEQTGREPLR